MKKLRLTKVIASTLMVVSVFALNPVGANAEWKQNSTGKWYSIGSSWATGWYPIDGSFYYFNNNGYMVTNSNVNGMELGSDGRCKISTNQNNVDKNGEILIPYQLNSAKRYDGSTSDRFSVFGVKYTEGFAVSNGALLLFNLDGKYEKVKMKVGHIDDSPNNGTILTVYADGNQVNQTQVYYDDAPVEITIPVNNAKQLKIETKTANYYGAGGSKFGISNIIGY